MTFPSSWLVTLPACNEGERLATAVRRVDGMLQELGHPYTLQIAEDGSTDNTFRIAKDLTSSFPNLQVIHHESKLGRGKALREAWVKRNADVYMFMDADLATDLSFMPSLVEKMQTEQLDFVTGSRYCSGSRLQRPLLRKTVSLGYNMIVNTIFGTSVTDHQCGFKAFSERAVKRILPLTKENGWAWDTEVIVYLTSLGFRMAEVPVNWREMKGNRTPIRRLFKDVVEHGTALFRILMRTHRLRSSRNV